MTATKEKAIIKAADMPDVRVGDRDARADAFSRRRADATTRRRDKVNENDDDDERDD
jgi:hypothetical protein